MHLRQLFRYPLKSGADEALTSARVTARGLAGDRRWMLADADNRFVTGRRHPQLVRVHARQVSAELAVTSPGRPALRIAVPDGGPRRRVTVWADPVDAADAGDAAARWFSELLAEPVRLVYMDSAARRAVDPAHSADGDTVSFADGFPLLLINRASMIELNRRIGRDLDLRRFRPNLVVDGTEAFAEDHWRHLRVGDVAFDVVKACSRCRFTTVDPDTGERSADGEPLRTLARFRAGDDGVLFGQNLIPRGSGEIRVGDAVTVGNAD